MTKFSDSNYWIQELSYMVGTPISAITWKGKQRRTGMIQNLAHNLTKGDLVLSVTPIFPGL